MTISKFFTLPSISLLVLFFLSIELSTAQVTSDYPAMTNAGADDMAMTYAFYMGQMLSVQKIVSDFPELSNAFNQTQAEFDKLYKPSIVNIDAILTIENSRWSSSKTNLINALQSEVSTLNFNVNEANEFLELVDDRVNGDLPNPILETLLIYNPKYLKQPALEFLEGNRRVFSTKDHPKSKGVNFQIEYPISWNSREGVRPNIITLMNSENGRGLESITLLVNEIDISKEESETLTENDVDELFHEDFVAEILPNDSQIVSIERIELDGLPGASVLFDMQKRQLDMNIKMRNLYYYILYQNKLIFLQFVVAVEEEDASSLTERFEKFRHLFRLIGNSFVIQDQWKPKISS